MLTVLSVAYPLAAAGPDAVGGAEQVLARLDAALVAEGHRSLVVACAGSSTVGRLIATPPSNGPLDPAARAAAQAAHRAAIAETLARWPVDLVHLHGIDFRAYLPPPGVPVLATLHLPLAWYPSEALRPARPMTWLHAVSPAQRRDAPRGIALLPDIENGVDLPPVWPHAKRGFALALGRICPEKGFHHALDAARATGVPLLLGGRVYGYPEHERHYRDDFLPRLDRRRRFIGPVAGARKRRLLAAARCLLVPSLVAEIGSLVAMEALAHGTPVVAYPNGALADVVEDGVTGFLVGDGAGMARAHRRLRADRPRGVPGGGARPFPGVADGAALLRPLREAGARSWTAPRRLRSRRSRPAPAWRRCDRNGKPCGAARPSPTPFPSPAWLFLWWRAFGGGGLLTLTVREGGGRLRGVVPLYVLRERGRRKLLPLGIGVTDRLDPLLDPRHAAPVVAHLARQRRRFDHLDLEDLDPASPLLAAPAPDGWGDERHACVPRPALA